MWQKNGTPSTGTGAREITDLTTLKFNFFISHILQAGDIVPVAQLDGDTGSNYVSRNSENGGAEGLFTSRINYVNSQTGRVQDHFIVNYVINVTAEEKLIISELIWGGIAGAGNAPNRNEGVSKWVNTTLQFDQVKFFDNTGDQLGADSQLSALGTD